METEKQTRIAVIATNGKVLAVDVDNLTVEEVKEDILLNYIRRETVCNLIKEGNIIGATWNRVYFNKQQTSSSGDESRDDAQEYKDEKEYYEKSSECNAFLFKDDVWHLDGSRIKEIGFAFRWKSDF